MSAREPLKLEDAVEAAKRIAADWYAEAMRLPSDDAHRREVAARVELSAALESFADNVAHDALRRADGPPGQPALDKEIDGILDDFACDFDDDGPTMYDIERTRNDIMRAVRRLYRWTPTPEPEAKKKPAKGKR